MTPQETRPQRLSRLIIINDTDHHHNDTHARARRSPAPSPSPHQDEDRHLHGDPSARPRSLPERPPTPFPREPDNASASQTRSPQHPTQQPPETAPLLRPTPPHTQNPFPDITSSLLYELTQTRPRPQISARPQTPNSTPPRGRAPSLPASLFAPVQPLGPARLAPAGQPNGHYLHGQDHEPRRTGRVWFADDVNYDVEASDSGSRRGRTRTRAPTPGPNRSAEVRRGSVAGASDDRRGVRDERVSLTVEHANGNGIAVERIVILRTRRAPVVNGVADGGGEHAPDVNGNGSGRGGVAR